MPPSVPVPTDNIYKFSCLFGLALIVAGIFVFATSYNSALENKIRYLQVTIPLDAKIDRSKAESDTLSMYTKLIKVTKENEELLSGFVGGLIGVGIMFSFYGAVRWYKKVQARDDQLVDLQIRKLSAEVKKLEAELAKLPDTDIVVS